VYCSGSGDYVHQDAAVELHDGEWALEDNALEMYCGDYVLSDEAIIIDLGDHVGRCTHVEDDDLCCTDDNETYIAGTYTPESEDDS